jgi:hypothetical protein
MRIVQRQGESPLPFESRIDPNSDEFRGNAANMRALCDELAKRRAEAAEGGPPRARERHVARGGPPSASSYRGSA